MSLTEILNEISKLSQEERSQVADAIRQVEGTADRRTVEEKQTELYRVLIADGLLKSIPRRTGRRRDFQPVPIKGKPLSETIIEERR